MTETPVFTGDRFAGFALSEDGQTVQMMIGTGEPGKGITVTMPVHHIPEFYLHLGVLIDSAVMAGVLPSQGGKPVRNVQSWKVGENSMAPNFTAILIDENLTQETLLLMTDLAALQMADAIQQKIFTGMSLDDQKAMLKEVEKATGRKPQLLIPGRS